MGVRRKARELALAVLYQIDLLSRGEGETLCEKLGKERGYPLPAVEFAREIVQGVTLNLAFIDSLIAKYSKNWDIQRMSIIDRNILRIAVFELLYREDIPPRVSIDEAIELSKTFSEGGKSKDFVNGVLDGIYREVAGDSSG